MTKYIAPSGLNSSFAIATQGSASLHPGLRVLRPFGTNTLVNAAPYQGKKKGADSGIDGLIFFHDDKSGAKKIVVSVKGGENVNVAMVRDLGHVVEREKASMGFFVTLAEPTRPMKEEAVSVGFYDTERFGTEYPKLQILTIEGLMNGTERPRFPDLTLGRSTFKRAAVEDMGAEQEKLQI